MSRRAALYLRAPAGVDPRTAVDEWLRSERFVPWESLPKGYPASPEEVREAVWRPPNEPGGWAELTPEAFEHVFRFALEIARRTPEVAALAVTDRWDGRVAAKLYQGDKVLLKVGEDRDDELSWFIPPPEPDHFVAAGRTLALPRSAADALSAWGRRVISGEPPDLRDLARAFALPGPPGRFAERRAALSDRNENAGEYLLHVHRTSPLYRNA